MDRLDALVSLQTSDTSGQSSYLLLQKKKHTERMDETFGIIKFNISDNDIIYFSLDK